MSKIVHYRNKCIGCGICYDMQPDIWRMSTKDGKATLVNSIVKNKVHLRNVYDWDKPLAMSVATACPAKIIKII